MQGHEKSFHENLQRSNSCIVGLFLNNLNFYMTMAMKGFHFFNLESKYMHFNTTIEDLYMLSYE